MQPEENIHALLRQRIGRLQEERTGLWQKVRKFMRGE